MSYIPWRHRRQHGFGPMSYIPWGTPLGLSFAAATGEADPMDGYIAWHHLGPEQRQTEADRQGAALSTWYIYWDTGSDDALGRNGQLAGRLARCQP